MNLEKQQKLGLCSKCNRSIKPGNKHCEYHLEKYRIYRLNKYYYYKSIGCCVHCGSTIDEDEKITSSSIICIKCTWNKSINKMNSYYGWN